MNDYTNLHTILAQSHKSLEEVIDRIESHTRTMACTALAQVLYTPEDLRILYGQLEAAFTQHRQAQEEVQAICERPEFKRTSFDSYAKLHGEDAARDFFRSFHEALERQTGTYQALGKFRSTAPLVYELNMFQNHLRTR